MTITASPGRPGHVGRPRTQTERNFLALGGVAEQFLVGAAAAGVSNLPSELAEIMQLTAAHGTDAVLAALQLAGRGHPVRPGRRRRRAHTPRPAGEALILTLPVSTRPLSAYKINTSEGDS
jgi:hypothetical protein